MAKKTGKKDLLNRITYMIDPLEIKAQGITVHKANQRPGQFICTFFKVNNSSCRPIIVVFLMAST